MCTPESHYSDVKDSHRANPIFCCNLQFLRTIKYFPNIRQRHKKDTAQTECLEVEVDPYILCLSNKHFYAFSFSHTGRREILGGIEDPDSSTVAE